MNRLAVLLLAACFAMPACSANDDTEQAAADAATRAGDGDTVVIAQVDSPAPTQESSGDIGSNDEPTAAAPRTEAIAAADPAVVIAQANRPASPPTRSDIVEGTHYTVLTPAQPTSSSPDQVEVAEVFMYMCPHCFTFEPFIKQYIADKPDYVSFVRIPASFNKIARVHAKGFYAADTLGVLDDVHLEFFRAYHTENKRLGDEKAVVDFLVANGVAREEADMAMKSFAVDTKVRQADNLMRRYRISSVPTLVINGKYVTSASMAGSMEKLRQIIDYLVAKEAAAM